MSVPVSVILDSKGHEVLTTSAEATIAHVTALMVERGIGALVVTDGAEAVEGIVSERDVLRGLAEHGAGLLDRTVADIMTSTVRTCAPDTRTGELAETMTEGRIRHLPVVDDGGRLVGIISIGDVVKSRIDELAAQAESLEAYVSGTTY